MSSLVPPPPPEPRTVRFDPEKLYLAIDRQRRELRLSNRAVLRQMGEPSSASLNRIGRGACPSADLLARMLVWLGDTDIGPYITRLDP